MRIQNVRIETDDGYVVVAVTHNATVYSVSVSKGLIDRVTENQIALVVAKALKVARNA